MTEIAFDSSFSRALKKILKHDATFEEVLNERLTLFRENPFEPTLQTHKLSGKLQELHSFSVNYKIRIIFYFFEEKAVFIDIGKHDDVY
jgi:mRNA-degrading endonuclease YafQ of YafQ-DinJ toxin-antitoxin module